MTTINSFVYFIIASPLDQFGIDSDFYGLLDNPAIDFISESQYLDEFINFVGLTEVDSAMDLFAIVLSVSGAMLFDDEDCSDSE